MDQEDRQPFNDTPVQNDEDAGGFGDEHKRAIDRMMSDRGGIVNSFAQVAYLLADTVVRCADLAAYDKADTTLPYRLDQRVARFAALLPLPGPLNDQRDSFERVVSDFREAEERRQFLVHGFASFHFTRSGDMAMRFDRFMPSRDEPARRRSMWFRPKTLSDIRTMTSERTSFALAEFIALHTRMGWLGD